MKTHETMARYLAIDYLLSVLEPVVGRPFPLLTDETRVRDLVGESASEAGAAQEALSQALGGPVQLDETPVWMLVDELRRRFPNHAPLQATPPAVDEEADGLDEDAPELEAES